MSPFLKWNISQNAPIVYMVFAPILFLEMKLWDSFLVVVYGESIMDIILGVGVIVAGVLTLSMFRSFFTARHPPEMLIGMACITVYVVIGTGMMLLFYVLLFYLEMTWNIWLLKPDPIAAFLVANMLFLGPLYNRAHFPEDYQ